MSLVALKNIFLYRTFTPIPPRQRQIKSPLSDWNDGSDRPLLPSKDSARPQDDLDTESQCTAVSKNENPFHNLDVGLGQLVHDATLGLSDGLTVPFALTAGLSALGRTKVVIYGGLAEIIAGAISMGLGGYLGAQSEVAEYHATKEKVNHLIDTKPEYVVETLKDVFKPFGLPESILKGMTSHLEHSPDLVDFIMQFQHCAKCPDSSRAATSAATVGTAYLLGGLLPLIPYFFVASDEVYKALYISIGIMVLALFAFGYAKTCIFRGWDGGPNIRAGCVGGIEMVFVGSAAAGAAMGLVRLFSQGDGA